MTPWILNGKVLVDKFGRPILCDECPCVPEENICCFINMDRSRLTPSSDPDCPDRFNSDHDNCFVPPGHIGVDSKISNIGFDGQNLDVSCISTFDGETRDAYRVGMFSGVAELGNFKFYPLDFTEENAPEGCHSTHDWVMELWIDTSDIVTDGTGRGMFFGADDFNSTGPGNNDWLEFNCEETQGRLRYLANAGTGSEIARTSPSFSYSSGVHHFLFQWQASSETLQGYVDGSQEFSMTSNNGTPSFFISSVSGPDRSTGVIVRWQGFGGPSYVEIAQMLWGNHYFTSSEVQARYDAGVP